MTINFKYGDYNLGQKPALYVRKSLKFLKKSKIKDILDFGCGNGRNSFFLNIKGFNITAMDSQSVLNLYKDDFQKRNIFLKPFNIKNTKIPFESNSFDCILSWRVLHRGLKKYRYSLIKDLKRVLRKKGFLIMAVSMDKDIEIDQKRGKKYKEIEKNTFEYIKKGVKNTRHYYTKKEIISGKSFPGFRTISFSSFKEKTGHKGKRYLRNYWKIILQKP
ncbi:MAG: class I SAM-dependent methyltransferase [Nanoarchaeota archaeon]